MINHDEPETLEITLPRPGASFRLDPLIPVAGQKITLSARATDDVKTVQWSVDGRTVCTARSPDFRCLWQPVVGSHTIFAIGGGKEARVTMEVIR